MQATPQVVYTSGDANFIASHGGRRFLVPSPIDAPHKALTLRQPLEKLRWGPDSCQGGIYAMSGDFVVFMATRSVRDGRRTFACFEQRIDEHMRKWSMSYRAVMDDFGFLQQVPE